MPWDPDAEAFECDNCADWTDAVIALTAQGAMALRRPEAVVGRLPPLPFQARGAETLCLECWANC